MNTIKLMFVIMLLLSCNACAGESVRIDLTVVDQDGNPLSGVKAELGFGLPNGGGSRYVGYTDDEGRITETRRAAFGVGIVLEKPGYYRSVHVTGYGDQALTMELREIRKPIAMHVHKLRDRSVIRDNISNQSDGVGYDLKLGDFVAPLGDGKVADLLFSGAFNSASTNVQPTQLNVSFSNPKDGFVPFYIENASNLSKSDPESIYKSDYLAPDTGYVDQWSYAISRNGVDSSRVTTVDKNRNYYFRVRSEVDEEGNIISAHYGKIYGELLYSDSLKFYFNPTANDRNIEFDLERNLSPKRIVGELRP